MKLTIDNHEHEYLTQFGHPECKHCGLLKSTIESSHKPVGGLEGLLDKWGVRKGSNLEACILQAYHSGQQDERESHYEEIKGVHEAYKKIIQSAVQDEREKVRGMVEGMKVEVVNCYCREYPMGEHDCAFTVNNVLDDILSSLSKTDGEGL